MCVCVCACVRGGALRRGEELTVFTVNRTSSSWLITDAGRCSTHQLKVLSELDRAIIESWLFIAKFDATHVLYKKYRY